MFIATENGLLFQLALCVAVGHQTRIGANLIHIDDANHLPRNQTTDLGILFEFFYFQHEWAGNEAETTKLATSLG